MIVANSHILEISKSLEQILVPVIAINEEGEVCAENALVKDRLHLDSQKLLSKSKWKSTFGKLSQDGFVAFHIKIEDKRYQLLGSMHKDGYGIFSIFYSDKIVKDIVSVNDAYLREKEKEIRINRMIRLMKRSI